jgi:hypothetical protein
MIERLLYYHTPLCAYDVNFFWLWERVWGDYCVFLRGRREAVRKRTSFSVWTGRDSSKVSHPDCLQMLPDGILRFIVDLSVRFAQHLNQGGFVFCFGIRFPIVGGNGRLRPVDRIVFFKL